MRQVTIYTTDKEYNHFVELVKNLQYVKKIEIDQKAFSNHVIDNIKVGLEEVKLFKRDN